MPSQLNPCQPAHRSATIIEDTIIDLSSLEIQDAFNTIPEYPKVDGPFSQPTLNLFASLSADVRRAARAKIQELWKDGELSAEGKYAIARVAIEKAASHLPMETQNYTDYVSSRGHFENVSFGFPSPPDGHLFSLSRLLKCTAKR